MSRAAGDPAAFFTLVEHSNSTWYLTFKESP